MALDLSPLCFQCGQCCQHFRVSFYHGEVEGSAHSGVPAELVTPISPHRVCMKGTELGGSPCVALTHNAEEGYRCSIYANRPSPCREFNVLNDDGSENEDCKKLRLRHNLPLPNGSKPLHDANECLS
ncbi:MAG: YkgJ family cysteine cluster protein [Burkholderiaceae bacterium]